MSNRLIYYMTGLVLAAIVFLFGFNLVTLFWNPYPQTYIANNQIRGMAVQYQGLPFTLNFEQQNEAADYLNQATKIKKDQSIKEGDKPEFEKLTIYRFNAPDIVITPISISNNTYILSVPAWNAEGYLQDTSSGALQRLLTKTYESK